MLGVMGSDLMFFADDGVSGAELWRSDGTETGTRIVADVREGPPGSSRWPFSATVVLDRLFFIADDGEHGIEVWMSDGTASGTVLWSDISPGLGSARPKELVSLGP
jgi:ELWxxDGT repeat protein